MTAELDLDDLVEEPPAGGAGTGDAVSWSVALLVAVTGGVLALLDADPIALACLGLTAALALVRTDVAYVAPHSHGLPGIADGAPRVVAVGARTHLVAVLLGAALVAAAELLELPDGEELPVWAPLPIVLLVAVVTWLRAAPWVVGRRHAVRLRRALEAHAPTVGLVYGGRSGGPWQLGMWEPHVAASGEPAVVLNVHARYVPLILEGAGLSSPLVQLGSRGTAELDELLVPSLQALFYVQNARSNIAFLTREHLTHVWLGHGDSDKPTSHNPLHAAYDLVAVAGPAAIQRYERHGVQIPASGFVVVGRPQTAGIVPVDGPPRVRDEVTVLYAPTWQGPEGSIDFSSLDQAPALVLALLERGATVIFRPHPLSYRWRDRREVIHEVRALLKRDAERSGRRHRWGRQVDTEWSLVDCINRSDALLSDVSAVVSDHLASGKPFAVIGTGTSVEQLHDACPVSVGGGVVLSDLSNLGEVLDVLRAGDDDRFERRLALRRHVLGDFTGEEAAAAFADVVRALAEGD